MEASAQRPMIAEYYGETLKTSSDLKTSACCPIDAVPPEHRHILSKLHPDVISRFYGCGSPIPDSLSGQTILDLGCGTGRDVFLAAALAGENGRVIGVDMTDSQLKVARDTAQFHADTFFGKGAKPNTDFRKGYIEDLRSANIEDDSVDVVISNCVCNLSTDKRAVFSEVYRVLRQGGEFYFSDVYPDRRLSEEAQKDPVLVAECLGAALYLEDFRRIMAEVGFRDIRVVTSGTIELHDPELLKLVHGVRFYSVTTRAFKIDALEDRRENYGQLATYSSGTGDEFKLDATLNFRKGAEVPVDANTATILELSRFKKKFTVSKRGAHQGLFSPEMESGAFAGTIYKESLKTEACCAPGSSEKEKSCCGPEVTNGNQEAGCCNEETSCCAPAENGEGEQQSCCAPSRTVTEAEAKSDGCGLKSTCC